MLNYYFGRERMVKISDKREHTYDSIQWILLMVYISDSWKEDVNIIIMGYIKNDFSFANL